MTPCIVELTPCNTLPPTTPCIVELTPSSLKPPAGPSNTGGPTQNKSPAGPSNAGVPTQNKSPLAGPSNAGGLIQNNSPAGPSNAGWFNQQQSLNTPWWPNKVSTIITSIISIEDDKPKPSSFEFELSIKAAHKNFCVLRKFDFNLKSVIKANSNSPIGYGSEF